MRVLFTFAGGSGHADPLVPVAVAVREAGHDVAFAGHPSGTGTAEGRGFTMLTSPVADRADEPLIAPLVPLDMRHEYEVLRDFYAGTEARERATRILELSAGWAPDLIVCDEVDFGAMVAAERLGLPHATVLVTATGSFVRPDVVVSPLDVLRAEHGLPPDPDLRMPSRYLVVSPFAPSFRDPAVPLPPNAHAIRSESVPSGDLTPPWLPPASGLPIVYFTLGTVFNTESGDLFQRVLAGLGALPIEVVVTVGRDLDPGVLGPQSAHVRVERYLAQSTLLPHCDLVVNHGGSGSVVGALAHGLPMLVIPMGADQSLNATRSEQLGVGIQLDALGATPASIQDAAARILATPSYRQAAEGIRDEIAALPGPGSVVPLLEGIAAA